MPHRDPQGLAQQVRVRRARSAASSSTASSSPRSSFRRTTASSRTRSARTAIALDAMVLVGEPTFPGCVIEVRAIAVLRMADDQGQDDKIVCVPCQDPALERARAPRRHPLPAADRDRALLLDLQAARGQGRRDPGLRGPRRGARADRGRARAVQRLTDFAVRALEPATWPDFAALVEAHNARRELPRRSRNPARLAGHVLSSAPAASASTTGWSRELVVAAQ